MTAMDLTLCGAAAAVGVIAVRAFRAGQLGFLFARVLLLAGVWLTILTAIAAAVMLSLAYCPVLLLPLAYLGYRAKRRGLI